MTLYQPAPNIPECTCDRDDDSWVGEGVPMPLCPYHEKRLRHLSWESLACIYIDFEAALREKGTLTLDEAWAAVEAVLPEGWHNGPTLQLFGYDVMDGGRAYVANVTPPRPYPRARARTIVADGPTPAAALLALAEKLAQR